MSNFNLNNSNELEILKNEFAQLIELLPLKYLYSYGMEPSDNDSDREIVIAIEKKRGIFNKNSLTSTYWAPSTELSIEEKNKRAIKDAENKAGKFEYENEVSKIKLEYENKIAKLKNANEKEEKAKTFKIKELNKREYHEPEKPEEISKLKLKFFPSARKKQKEAEEKYERDCKKVDALRKGLQTQILNIKNTIKENKQKLNADIKALRTEMQSILKKMKDEYNQNFDNYKKEWIEKNKWFEQQIQEIDKKLEKLTHIPKKYFKFYYAEKIYDIIDTQRADTVKDVYNLAEQEIREEEHNDAMYWAVKERTDMLQKSEDYKNRILSDSEDKKNKLLQQEIENKQKELERHHYEMEQMAFEQKVAEEERAQYAKEQAKYAQQQAEFARQQANSAAQQTKIAQQQLFNTNKQSSIFTQQNSSQSTFNSAKCFSCRKNTYCQRDAKHCTGFVPKV